MFCSDKHNTAFTEVGCAETPFTLRVALKFEVEVNLILRFSFLGAFAKLRKRIVSFALFVRMKQLGSHWTDFDETWYLNFFLTFLGRIQVSLKSDKNYGYYTRRFHIYDNILLNYF